MSISRIRSRSGIIEEGKDVGKWAFEVSLWTFDGEHQVGEPFGPFGPFDSQLEAIEESKRCVQLIAEVLEKTEGQKPSGKYIDFKNGGVLRNWENH